MYNISVNSQNSKQSIKKSDSNNITMIILIVLFVIIIVGVIIYVTIDKDDPENDPENDNTLKSDLNKLSEQSESTALFNNNFVINGERVSGYADNSEIFS